MRYISNVDAIPIVLKLDPRRNSETGYPRDHFPTYLFTLELETGIWLRNRRQKKKLDFIASRNRSPFGSEI